MTPGSEYRGSEDRKPATSRVIYKLSVDKSAHWGLEVRSEDFGNGSLRLGEVVLVEHVGGQTTLRILSESGIQ